MFTFQFLQSQAQNFLLRVCQRCTHFSIYVKTLSVFYQHSSEIFTDSSAVLLRKLRDPESDCLKQLMMLMLISSFVTNLQNICGRKRIKRRERCENGDENWAKISESFTIIESWPFQWNSCICMSEMLKIRSNCARFFRNSYSSLQLVLFVYLLSCGSCCGRNIDIGEKHTVRVSDVCGEELIHR